VKRKSKDKKRTSLSKKSENVEVLKTPKVQNIIKKGPPTFNVGSITDNTSRDYDTEQNEVITPKPSGGLSPKKAVPNNRTSKTHSRHKKKRPGFDESQTQTNPVAYINFACEMFLNEIIQVIKEEKDKEMERKFKELLVQAEHIILKIKSKAMTPYGNVV
jgi:hypothetical protein